MFVQNHIHNGRTQTQISFLRLKFLVAAGKCLDKRTLVYLQCNIYCATMNKHVHVFNDVMNSPLKVIAAIYHRRQ